MIRRPPTSHAGSPRGLPRNRSKVSPGKLDWRARAQWGAGIAIVLTALVYLLWPVFSLLFVAVVFAYLLDPLVDRIERRGHSREFGIVALFLITLLGLAIVVLGVIPSVAKQVEVLSTNIGPYFTNFSSRIQPYSQWIEAHTGTPVPVNIQDLGKELPTYLDKLSPDAQDSIKKFLAKTLSGGVGLVNTVLNLCILPLFVFYVLRDWDRTVGRVAALVPPQQLALFSPILKEIDDRLSSFVRGQILVAFLLGVIYSLGLWIFAGIDMPIIVGMLAGVLFIVPYLGSAVGILLATSLSLLKFGFDYHILVVLAVFGGAQMLEGMVLTPHIVGEKVGLSPLTVMIALIAGGSLLGIWGMLLAIPCAAAISVVLRFLIVRYTESAFYKQL
jgi:predicted PurR-regulated permease PerM